MTPARQIEREQIDGVRIVRLAQIARKQPIGIEPIVLSKDNGLPFGSRRFAGGAR